ncbi:MAG: metallophosphoesterase [Lachnospiraceae bacterium]|nr:metallophosphoesterase [Lachnospiraceae bacterium]
MIYILIILFLIGILVFIDGILECKRFRVKKYTIKSEKINNEVRIVMFADLHNVFYDEKNSKLERTIRSLNPDIILLPGDMLVCRHEKIADGYKTLEFLNRISCIAPVYYSYGNHEKGISEPDDERFDVDEIRDFNIFWKDYTNKLSSNIHLMKNEQDIITINNSKLLIFGYDIPRAYYKRMTEAVLRDADIEYIDSNSSKDCYNIMLAHNPDFFDYYSKTGFDLVLSGHNHGGMLKIPFWRGFISPRLNIFPKYSYGLYDKSGTKMLLTGGLGIHTFKFRINNVPELVFIKLQK